jgi:glycosyltransferase involved in cell wall biosynthesis
VRVLFVVHGFPPLGEGGAELHAAALARELERGGDEVFVFSAARGAEAVARAGAESGERLRFLPFRGGGRDPLLRLRDRRVREAFDEFLTETKPDVVHVQHLLFLSSDLIEVAAARGIPVVTTLHDLWFQCPLAHPLPGQRHRFRGALWGLSCFAHFETRSWMHRLALPLRLPLLLPKHLRRPGFMRRQLLISRRIVVPSVYLRQAFGEFGVPEDRMTVIPHGTDLAAAEGGPVGTPVVFGIVATLTPHKGVHVACEAFARDGGDSKLHLYGRVAVPAYARSLERRFGPRIELHGGFDREDLPRILGGIDVLVVPSLAAETFSLAAVEAQAAGLPLIVSNIGALAERVEEGVNGLLVPPGDVGALAAAIERLRDPTQVERLRTGVRPPLTAQEHAAQIRELYEAASRESESVGAPDRRV